MLAHIVTVLISIAVLAALSMGVANTANAPQVFGETPDTDWYDYPVKVTTHIYQGDALTKDATTGNAHPLTAGEDFLGFAEHEANNTTGASSFGGATVPTGTAAEGGITVSVRHQGQIVATVALASTGLNNATDKDLPVYMTDSATFTFSSSGSAVKIGYVRDWLGVVTAGTSGSYLVQFYSKAGVRS